MEEEQVQQSRSAQKLPPGYRFNPSEQELVGYLFNHVSGSSAQNIWFCPVVVCDVYSEEPWDIWPRCQYERFGLPKGDVFLITKLKKSKIGSTELSHFIGSSGATWHQTVAPKELEFDCGSQKLCGLRKKFCYKNPKSAENGCWLLTEYTVSFDNRKTYSEDAICRLQNNHKTTSTEFEFEFEFESESESESESEPEPEPEPPTSSKLPRISIATTTLSPDLSPSSASNDGVGSSSMTNIHNALVPTIQSHHIEEDRARSESPQALYVDDDLAGDILGEFYEDDIEPDSTGQVQQVQFPFETNEQLQPPQVQSSIERTQEVPLIPSDSSLNSEI